MLEVRELSVAYGRAQVLFDLSFTARGREVLVLLGRNGAGKSTTLKALIGLVPALSGEIRFDRQRLERLAPYQIARLGLGYVPEDRRIFTDLSVSENLEVGRQPAREGVPRWSPERVFELFPDLGRMRHRLGARMSGGEQQMLSIARTLMGNPRAILLDEPAEGLAPLVVEKMALALRELKHEGLCIVLSEQSGHFAAQIADRALIIEKGHVRFDGTLAELEANPGVREQHLSL